MIWKKDRIKFSENNEKVLFDILSKFRIVTEKVKAYDRGKKGEENP